MCKHLDIKARLVVYYLQCNVDPKSSDIHKVRNTDLYYMDKLFFSIEKDRKLPLASIIIKAMRGVVTPKKMIRCPIFLVLIIGIDVSGELTLKAYCQ